MGCDIKIFKKIRIKDIKKDKMFVTEIDVVDQINKWCSQKMPRGFSDQSKALYFNLNLDLS